MGSRKPDFGVGASPGKILIGGLAKDATLDKFVKNFEKYGEITDSVIMKDRDTGRPRGFAFITYADPAVVDSVIADTLIINNKTFKRMIPKGSAESKVFRTKKIFVDEIPASLSEDEVKSFFSKYGAVIEHGIIPERDTKLSRGFGFIVFDNEQVVDTILSKGNSIDIDGTQVEIKKAEAKKPSNPASAPAFPSHSRGYGGFDNSFGSRFGNYGGYGDGGTGVYCGRYGDFPGGAYVGRFGDYSGYVGDVANRYGSYVWGYSEGYSRSGLGAYGRGGGYGGYSGGTVPGSGYKFGPGAGYESGAGNEGAGGQDGSRTGFSGDGRYDPNAR